MVDDDLLGGKRGAILQDCAAARIGSRVDIFPAAPACSGTEYSFMSRCTAIRNAGYEDFVRTVLITSAPLRHSAQRFVQHKGVRWTQSETLVWMVVR